MQLKQVGDESFLDGELYMTLHVQGLYFPATQPTGVGQKVLIDWSNDTRDNTGFKPPLVPDVRTVIITRLPDEKTCISLIREEHEPDGSHSGQLYFDSRGGWTEIRECPLQKRPLYYSHPIVKFMI